MVRRVLLASEGLKVSRPTVDVVGASGLDLLFDSSLGSYGLYAEGTHNFTWSVNGLVGEHNSNVSLGKTFPTPPAVLFQRSMGSGVWQVMGNASGFGFKMESTDDPQYTFDAQGVVTTTQIQFRGWYQRPSGGWPAPTLSIRYAIYEYNL